MKTVLDISNDVSQALAAGEAVNLGSNDLLIGDGAIHVDETPSVVLARKGVFLILFDADFIITTTGPVTFTLMFKDNAIATDTVQATATEPIGVHINKVIRIRPSCCAIDNRGAFKIVVSAAGSVAQAHTIVIE